MEVDPFLAHYGVVGMKWGVRKVRVGDEQITSVKRNLSPNADGSIDIPKGSIVQRVVNSKGLARKAGVDLNDGPTYASFTKGDNLRYESYFGATKGLFVSESSRVLKLTAKVDLKAPTPKATAAMYFQNLKDNPAQRETVRNTVDKQLFGSAAKFDKALRNPGAKDSFLLYSQMYDIGNYNQKFDGINSSFHDVVKKAGFNTILDPSDSSIAFDAPIVILEGRKSLAVTGKTVVTKESSKKVAKLAEEQEILDEGKMLLQRLGIIDT